MEILLLRVLMGLMSITVGGILFLGVLKVGIYIQENINDIKRNKK